MKLVLLNKNTDIIKYKDCKVLNLCIYSSFERFFDINPQEYFNQILPANTFRFKEKYLNKIDRIATEFFDRAGNDKSKIEVLSYRTFSKLTVSDKLIDKFWVVEQIKNFENDDIFVFLDDCHIYNIFSSKKNIDWSQKLIPYKQLFYFFIFLIRKLKSNKPNILFGNESVNFFVGHKYEEVRNKKGVYDEYFFSKYWQNNSNSFLLLNVSDSHFRAPYFDNILFKESFLTIFNLFNLLFLSLKHFYFPFQIEAHDVEDRLINLNLKMDVHSGAFIDSFVNFYIYHNLSNLLKFSNGRIIIPHEGRSYEKIICQLFKKHENFEVIGYAHFPVSEKIFNYYYKDFESRVYDKFKFYTLSMSNFNFFKHVYKWPIKTFKIGAHLKSKISENLDVKKNPRYDILLLLGNDFIPNLKLLKFLKFSIGTCNFNVLVRLHPSANGKKYIFNLIKKFGFFVSENSNLEDDAISSKLIAYGDTGASIDCLKFNLPLCYLMDDNCLISDRIQNDVFGHLRFSYIKDFQTELPLLLLGNLSISNEKILIKYISDIKPEKFIFD